MNTLFKNILKAKMAPGIKLFFLLWVLTLLPGYASSQKKELTISTKVTKIALIDHTRLRKEYKEFSSAREKLSKENNADKKSFDQALLLLNNQTQQDLRIDSLAGGNRREEIIRLAAVKRTGLMNSFQLKQKKNNLDKIALMQTYEGRINSAIATVVNEGGFTEIKPLSSDSTTQRSVDVTNLILRKLN